MTSDDKNKNAVAAIVLCAMAVLSGVAPPHALAAAGVAAAVAAMGALGMWRGLAILAPIVAFGDEWIMPPAFAVAASSLLDENPPKPLSAASVSAFAMAAGLSYSYLAFPEQRALAIEPAAAAIMITAAGAALLTKTSASGPFRPALLALCVVFILYFMSQVSWSNIAYSHDPAVGFMISAALGAAAFAEGKIDMGGALSGTVIGCVIYTSTGFAGFAMLFSFVAVAVMSTTISGRGRGMPEGYGKRGALNVAANTGPAAGFAMASLFTADPLVFDLGFMGCLAAALADTVSSELGMMYGEKPFDIVTWRRAEPGADGAISAEGSLLGLMAASFMGMTAVMADLTTGAGAMVVALGGCAGFMVDSWLGSTLETRGLMSNNAVNAWSTLAGGLTAATMGLAFF